MITRRLKNITVDELINYSHMYGFFITEDTALDIVYYLRHLSLDPFKTEDLEQIFHDLEKLTDQQTVNRVRLLFEDIIQQYDVQHLFEN